MNYESPHHTKTIMGINTLMRQQRDLRDKLEKVRHALTHHISDVSKQIEEIQAAERIEYSGWVALFQSKESGGFDCVAVIDGNNPPEDLPEWDVFMAIPKPDSLSEFKGW